MFFVTRRDNQVSVGAEVTDVHVVLPHSEYVSLGCLPSCNVYRVQIRSKLDEKESWADRTHDDGSFVCSVSI